jgi:hypothetical protein
MLGDVPALDIVITAVKLLLPRAAVTITHPVAVLPVVKVKGLLDVEPFATATFAGTTKTGSLLINVIVDTPILGYVKLAVQIPELPAITLDGVQLRFDSKIGGDKKMTAACELPFSVAVTIAVEPPEKVPACARNEPEDDPLETDRGEETERAGLLLESVIETVFPSGTAPVRFTAQVVEVWASRALAAQMTDEIPPGGYRVMVAVAVVPFAVAPKVAV